MKPTVNMNSEPDSTDPDLTFPAQAAAKGCALACFVPAAIGGLLLFAGALAGLGGAHVRWGAVLLVAAWTALWLGLGVYLWRRADRTAFTGL
jgi:hypothetical protein